MIITLDASLDATRRRFVNDSEPHNVYPPPPKPPGAPEWTPARASFMYRGRLVQELADPETRKSDYWVPGPDVDDTPEARQVVSSSLPFGAEAYHRNYLDYVEASYARHYGVVVAPHTLWYVVLSEIASAVKASPETFRALFSTSAEKQDIHLMKGPGVDVVAGLLREVARKVPTPAGNFLPAFSTQTDASVRACQVAFLDAVSPFYNYWVLSCGIPRIRLDGTKADWKLFESSVRVLAGLMPSLAGYLGRVADRIEGVVGMFDARTTDEERVAFWKEFYYNERCGSGGETLVRGWIREFYREEPRLAKSCNYPPQVGQVEYTDLDNGRKYVVRAGLFSSTFEEEGGFLVPDFSFVEECLGQDESVTPGASPVVSPG